MGLWEQLFKQEILWAGYFAMASFSPFLSALPSEDDRNPNPQIFVTSELLIFCPPLNKSGQRVQILPAFLRKF